jgi:2-polyprenyl-6-hydroxyphenyl methylase/3-demethylubiquinone-9 3-methyltransferase
MSLEVPESGYKTEEPQHTERYLRPVIAAMLPALNPGARVLDIGCGNGYWAGEFLQRGCGVVGIDPSAEGIAIARRIYTKGRFEQTVATDDLLGRLGEAPFDLVISTEVVEHLYDPRAWARGAFRALRPGGRLICTTPYHGYLKNLVLAAANKWDSHLGPLWDGGHIKFWSRKTLSELLTEAGFKNIRFRGAGRLPFLWMSMVLSADKPA